MYHYMYKGSKEWRKQIWFLGLHFPVSLSQVIDVIFCAVKMWNLFILTVNCMRFQKHHPETLEVAGVQNSHVSLMPAAAPVVDSPGAL